MKTKTEAIADISTRTSAETWLIDNGLGDMLSHPNQLTAEKQTKEIVIGDTSKRIGHYKLFRASDSLLIRHFWKADEATDSETEQPEEWCLMGNQPAGMVRCCRHASEAVRLVSLGESLYVEKWGPHPGKEHRDALILAWGGSTLKLAPGFFVILFLFLAFLERLQVFQCPLKFSLRRRWRVCTGTSSVHLTLPGISFIHLPAQIEATASISTMAPTLAH